MSTSAGHDSRWPLIIGGSHRSGTTLLRRALNGHPQIFCPAEIKFHRDLLGQFPDDPLAHGRLGASIESLGLPRHEWLDALGRTFVTLLERAAARAGKARWADKNPEKRIRRTSGSSRSDNPQSDNSPGDFGLARP